MIFLIPFIPSDLLSYLLLWSLISEPHFMIGALATEWAQLLITQQPVAFPTQRGSGYDDGLS